MKKIAIILVIAMISIALIPVQNSEGSVESRLDRSTDEAYSYVLYSEGCAETNQIKTDSRTTAIDDLSTVTDPDTVVIIDEKMVEDRVKIANTITNLFNQGNPIVVISETPELFTMNKSQYRFTAFLETANAYCMGTAPDGGTVCHSISGYNDDETVNQIRNWVESLDSYSNDAESSGILYNDYYSYNSKCDHFGYLSGITIVSQIEDSNDDANFFLIHFNHEGDNSGEAISDLTVKSNVGLNNQVIYDHAPRNEADSGTITFTAGTSIGTDGINSNFSASWSHSYTDISYDDRTNLGAGLFEIYYDVDQGSDTGHSDIIVEPGMVVRTEASDGAYHGNDTYMVTFCNVVIPGLWHNDFRTYSLEAEYTIYPQ